MAKKQFQSSYSVSFQNKSGRAVSAISKAYSFRVLGPKGGVVIKNAVFPKVFGTAALRRDYVTQSINKIIQSRRDVRVRKRIRNLENRIARKERRAIHALEYGKEKEARKIEADVRGDVDLLREYVHGILESSTIRRSEASDQLSFKLQKKIDILKYTFLHEPLTLNEFNFSERINWLYPIFFKSAKSVYNIHGPRKYIFRLIYQDSKTEKSDTVLGFGTERVKIPSHKSLKIAIEHLLEYINKKFTKRGTGYFSKGFVGPRVYMLGFTIEVLKKEHRTSHHEYLVLRKERKVLTKKEKTKKELRRKEAIRLRRLLKTKILL